MLLAPIAATLGLGDGIDVHQARFFTITKPEQNPVGYPSRSCAAKVPPIDLRLAGHVGQPNGPIAQVESFELFPGPNNVLYLGLGNDRAAYNLE